MGHISSKRLITRLKQSPMTYVLLILLGFFFIYSAVGAYKKSRLANDRLNTAQKELSNLEDQKHMLTTELENANTPFGQEKALREKFNVVKEGEQVIVIVDKEDSPSSTPADEDESSFWKKLKGE